MFFVLRNRETGKFFVDTHSDDTTALQDARMFKIWLSSQSHRMSMQTSPPLPDLLARDWEMAPVELKI